eukprot:TRINITY_DN5049_c0_g4_i4.p1 TRINITY_DN5049_c0_g4~~TRINITY_DN5049_c0_g4_i4.p1  ORF type:complete len:141 (+),score=22.41 TRINITY_DN5049_c0_g4_i4:120-542(+)
MRIRSYSYKNGEKVALNFPLGKIEKSDEGDPVRTAVREFHEETNYSFFHLRDVIEKQLYLLNHKFYLPPGKCWMFYVDIPTNVEFIAKDTLSRNSETTSDDAQVMWISKKDIPQNFQNFHAFTQMIISDGRVRTILRTNE